MTATTHGAGGGTRRARATRRQQTLYGTGTGGQVTAADNVTLTIEAGAFVALTGASRSGKSTLLLCRAAARRGAAGVPLPHLRIPGHRRHHAPQQQT